MVTCVNEYIVANIYAKIVGGETPRTVFLQFSIPHEFFEIFDADGKFSAPEIEVSPRALRNGIKPGRHIHLTRTLF